MISHLQLEKVNVAVNPIPQGNITFMAIQIKSRDCIKKGVGKSKSERKSQLEKRVFQRNVNIYFTIEVLSLLLGKKKIKQLEQPVYFL